MDHTISVSVDQAGGTTADIVAAVAGKTIRVVSFCLSVSGAVSTVKSTFQDKTANTVRMTLVGDATTPVTFTFKGSDKDPAFEVLNGDALELVTGTAAAISGFITYQLV
jgi:hypothetical protein